MPELTTRVIVFLCVVLAALAALAWVFYRRRELHRVVREQFRTFRERAVILMDELDSLRQRHKTMTSTDPDFEVPMAGATRQRYDRINEDLDQLWDRWLRVMEIWNRAQERLAAGPGFSGGATEEARSLLEGGEIEDLVLETDHCRKELDRLNQAHERARSELHDVREELASVQHEITQGTGVLLPSDRHHLALQEAERSLADAELRIASDPVGAIELIQQNRSRLGELVELPDRRRGWSVTDLSSYPIFDELSAAAEQLRNVAGRLWSSSILGQILRIWLTLAVISVLFTVLLPLLPIAAFVLIPFLVLAALWSIARAQMARFWSLVQPSDRFQSGPVGRPGRGRSPRRLGD
ncbi:MAG: hypothetical protein U0790_04225 [Isosphaeraceae bacterium]